MNGGREDRRRRAELKKDHGYGTMNISEIPC